jgi:hypothetical protein
MWLPVKILIFILIPTHVALIFPYLSQLDQKTSHVVSEFCMWFSKQHDSISKPGNLFSTFTVCGFETTCWALCGVETTWVCGFEICLFLLDRTARIDTTKVSTCRGSFGGFETTCFQLDQAASFETTKISYFSCDISHKLVIIHLHG